MHKQTVVDQIEITRDGTLQLRLAKEVVDDDGSILSREWHRTLLPPGHDIDKQMALVNDHLAQMNCAAVDTAEIARVKAIAPVVWTDEVRGAYAARAAAASSPAKTRAA